MVLVQVFEKLQWHPLSSPKLTRRPTIILSTQAGPHPLRWGGIARNLAEQIWSLAKSWHGQNIKRRDQWLNDIWFYFVLTIVNNKYFDAGFADTPWCGPVRLGHDLIQFERDLIGFHVECNYGPRNTTGTPKSDVKFVPTRPSRVSWSFTSDAMPHSRCATGHIRPLESALQKGAIVQLHWQVQPVYLPYLAARNVSTIDLQLPKLKHATVDVSPCTWISSCAVAAAARRAWP